MRIFTTKQGGRVTCPDEMSVPRGATYVELDQGMRAVRSAVSGEHLRVLCVVHDWMPALAAGSERMMQHLLQGLKDAGHSVTVHALWQPHGTEYEYDGIRVVGGDVAPWLYDEMDVIVWHHGHAAVSVNALAAYWQVPHVSVIHNDRFSIPEIFATLPDAVVWNTEWVRNSLSSTYGARQHDAVVRPPLEYHRHHVSKTGDAVTLCNLSANKGVSQFINLVRAMPDTQFIGVLGSHGAQQIYDEPNLTTMMLTQDMRDVWARTRVLLMLSEYESYGMVCAEASASGIPVIASTEASGPREALSYTGVYLARDDVDAWKTEIEALTRDTHYYLTRSARSAARGLQLVAQSHDEVGHFVQRIESLCLS